MAEAAVAATAEVLISGMIKVLQEQKPILMPGTKMEKEQQDLLRLLEEIQPLMNEAELHAECNEEVRTWLSDVKAAAYDADDILDKSKYINLKAEAKASRCQNVEKGSRFLFKGWSTGEMQGSAERIRQVKKRISILVEKMREFNFDRSNGILQVHAERSKELTYSSQMESSVRNIEKEEIVQKLLNSSNNHEHKGIGISIVGEQGVGKTTLARLVCNDPQIKDHFECILWVDVRQELSPAMITKTILDQTIGKENSITENDTDLLQRCIYQQLSGKRYLLVLDDIWTDIEVQLGKNFNSWLQNDDANGSSLLVTTRSLALAQIFGSMSHSEYEMQPLMPDAIQALFYKRASISEEDCISSEMHEMGERIIDGCKGSLLLVNLMGGLMRFKKQPEEWQVVVHWLENLRHADGDSLSAILRLCYDNLSSEVKQCFAFCSVFPVGHYMDREVLIKLWIANGFISSDESTNPEEKGNMVFNELASRYFFDDVKEEHIDRGTYSKKHEYKSRVVCKMLKHLHDLAKSVAGSEYATQSIENFEQGSCAQGPEIRHLSITGHDSPLDVAAMFKSYPSLRTVIFPEDPFVRTVKNWSLQPGSNTLRVLHLRSAQFEQDLFELKQMVHLRYLDLSGSRIKRLPESTCSLYNLQTLNLSKCWLLSHLPEDMRYMRSLRHLYIRDCPKLRKMLPYLGELSCLQTLTTFIVGDHMGNSIEQLKDMRNLSGLLELYDLHKVKDGLAAEKAHLSSKSNLTNLTLGWGKQQLVMPKEDNSKDADEIAVWEALVPPHDQLRFLKIQQCGSFDPPNWLSNPLGLDSLVELHLIGCSQWKTLPAVWSLPCLRVLCLKHMVSLISICTYKSSCPSLFPSLKKLVLADLKRLKRWNQEEQMEESTSTFPILTIHKLDEMQITNCPDLIGIPDVPKLKHLTVCIENHELLHSVVNIIKSANTLVKADIGDALSEDMPIILLPTGQDSANSLRTVRLDSANSFFMNRKILPFWKLLGLLENLEIHNCENLSILPLDEFRNLKRLKRLSIRNCPMLTCLFQKELEENDFPRLETLEFYGCPSLETIPQFQSVLSLELDECPKIYHIPMLIKLQMLYLSCGSWTELPGGIGRRSNLRSLRLSKCYNITFLPGEFGELTRHGRFSLRTLIINACPKLWELPTNFDQVLSGLEELKISKSPRLETYCREGEYSSMTSRLWQSTNGSARPSTPAPA